MSKTAKIYSFAHHAMIYFRKMTVIIITSSNINREDERERDRMKNELSFSRIFGV